MNDVRGIVRVMSATITTKKLGELLHHWHDSKSDPIYGVGSLLISGKAVDEEQVKKARESIRKLLKSAQAGSHGWGQDEVQELQQISDGLAGLLRVYEFGEMPTLDDFRRHLAHDTDAQGRRYISAGKPILHFDLTGGMGLAASKGAQEADKVRSAAGKGNVDVSIQQEGDTVKVGVQNIESLFYFIQGLTEVEGDGPKLAKVIMEDLGYSWTGAQQNPLRSSQQYEVDDGQVQQIAESFAEAKETAALAAHDGGRALVYRIKDEKPVLLVWTEEHGDEGYRLRTTKDPKALQKEHKRLVHLHGHEYSAPVYWSNPTGKGPMSKRIFADVEGVLGMMGVAYPEKKYRNKHTGLPAVYWIEELGEDHPERHYLIKYLEHVIEAVGEYDEGVEGSTDRLTELLDHSPRAQQNPAKGNWALVKAVGMLDDQVLSVHGTKEAAEKAMRKRGGEPDSMFTRGMRIVNVGPGSGMEMIEIFGNRTIRHASRNPAKGGVMLNTAAYNIEKHLRMGDEVRGKDKANYFIRVLPPSYEGGWCVFQTSLKADFNPPLTRRDVSLEEAAHTMSARVSTKHGLTWHRKSKGNPARGKAVAKHGGYRWATTYEIWGEEDLEFGDTDRRGWEYEFSKKHTYKSLADLLADIPGPISGHYWEGWGSGKPYPGTSIHSSSDEDYKTGDKKLYYLHIEHADGSDLTQAEANYVDSALFGDRKRRR